MTRIRSLLVGAVALSLLLLAAPVAADTDPADVFVAESAAEGVAVTVMGSALLELSSSAAAVTDGEAAAAAMPAAIGGTPAGERAAASDGDTVRDPEDADDICQIEIPEPLAAVLGIGVLCGEAEATGDVPDAWAAASAGEVDVLDLGDDALAELTDVLAALDLEGLLEQVTEAVGEQVVDAVVADVLDPLADECETALEDLDETILDPILDGLDPVVDGLSDLDADALLDVLAALEDDLGELPAACAALLELLELDASGVTALIDIDGLVDALLAEGQALLAVELLGTEAEAGGDDGLVGAWAGASAADAAVGLSLSLAGLGDVLTDLSEDALGDLLDALDDIIGETQLGDLPALDDLVDEVFDESGALAGLLGDDLLAVTLAPGEAGVDLDLDTGEFDELATPAVVELGGPLFALSEAIDDLVGTVDESVLTELRASPLADLIEVSLLAESIEDDEVGGLPGRRATSGVASVTLLAAAEGGIEVEVASSTAAVGHDTSEPVVPAGPEPEPAEPTEPTEPGEDKPGPLPVTGGGALLLGLLAMAGATALGRRD
jgi:hypothetical protein